MVEQAGTYVLVFDNSFSRLMSKRLTFWADVKRGAFVASCFGFLDPMAHIHQRRKHRE